MKKKKKKMNFNLKYSHKYFVILVSICLLSIFVLKYQETLRSAKSVSQPQNFMKRQEWNETTCNENSFALGRGQKIISYSFKNGDIGYWIGFNEILASISFIYHGWQVRIYANETDINFLKSKMSSNYSFVFFCNINHLPPPMESIGNYKMMFWRLLPLGDPQVDVLIVRDLDSQILQRDKDAVDEWMRSNKTVHTMRDYFTEDRYIMGGMWGVKINDSSRRRIKQLRNEMMSLSLMKKYERKDDQFFIEMVFRRAFKNDIMAHDGYYCKQFEGTVPFPTKRNKERHFIGSRFYREGEIFFADKRCPNACRPKDHQDWIYC